MEQASVGLRLNVFNPFQGLVRNGLSRPRFKWLHSEEPHVVRPRLFRSTNLASVHPYFIERKAYLGSLTSDGDLNAHTAQSYTGKKMLALTLLSNSGSVPPVSAVAVPMVHKTCDIVSGSL